MGISRPFKETVQERALNDPAFRESLLTESINLMLEGDFATGKLVLRDYIDVTVGFEQLGVWMHTSPKRLMRLCSVKANPRAASLFAIISTLQQKGGRHLEVQMV